MAEMETEDWVQFFKEAGIPSDIAATYAITFNHNRIQLDMLLDLNREILREMGITLMGDVIAILRHAKNVHEQTAREKILLSKAQGLPSARPPIRAFRSRSPSPSVEVVPVVPTVGVPLKKQSTVQRIIGHYTRASGQDELTTVHAGSKMIAAPVTLSAQKVKPAVIQNSVSPVVPKKRTMSIEPTVETDGIPIGRKKARQVLPEHEGGYKITMPSGSTPRSRRILSSASMRQALQKKRQNVFERLGESSVSSTSETVSLSPSTAQEKTKITVTGLGKKIIKTSALDKSTTASVFSRLGEKTLVSSPTSDSSTLQEHVRVDVPLPYAGILKQDATPKKKKIIIVKSKKSNTMRADQEYQTSQGAAKSRLGITPFKKNNTRIKTVGILATSSSPVKTNVKARLGGNDSKSQLAAITQQKRIVKPETQHVFADEMRINITGGSTHNVKQELMRRKSVHFGSVQYLDIEDLDSKYQKEDDIIQKEKPTLYVKNSPLLEELASSSEELKLKFQSYVGASNIMQSDEMESEKRISFEQDNDNSSESISPVSNNVANIEEKDEELDKKNESIRNELRIQNKRPKDFYLQWALRRAQNISPVQFFPEDLFGPNCVNGELHSKK